MPSGDKRGIGSHVWIVAETRVNALGMVFAVPGSCGGSRDALALPGGIAPPFQP
ncbi:MAG: hypothetical protein QOF09_3400 [Alphaproteobacteria bacterium]|nr:hypothetical protein [Alphaproteobacteria bacterium]